MLLLVMVIIVMTTGLILSQEKNIGTECNQLLIWKKCTKTRRQTGP